MVNKRDKYNAMIMEFINEALNEIDDMRFGQFIQGVVFPDTEYDHQKIFYEEPEETFNRIKERAEKKEYIDLLETIKRIERKYEN